MRRAALALALLGAAAPVAAQVPLGEPASAIVTVDQEALFARSAWGRRVQAEYEAAAAALAAENRRIEAELGAEERALTERRRTTDPAAFRALATAFDARVTEIRQAQDRKERDLARIPDEGRAAFFRAVVPILGQLLRDRDAVAILDARAILLSVEGIDITEAALARIDASLGDGTGVAAPADPQSQGEPPASDPSAPETPAPAPGP